MRTVSGVVLVGVICLGLIVTMASVGLVEGEKPHFVKGALCLACHGALNKELVARYKETKHAQAKPAEGMQPVDIYRRCVGFNPADNTFFEAGVGCQNCHGPGSAHLAARTPDDRKAAIMRVDKLKTPKQKLSVCGRCHGQYTVNGQPFAAGFTPGDDLFALEGFQLAKVTAAGPFQQLNELESSKHGANDVTCVTCHTAHEAIEAKPQLRKPVPDLCLQCHADAHKCTVKPENIPAGATCVTCHMPEGRHVFAVPK